MKLLNKLLSVALSSAIVFGCGSLVSADSKYAIDSKNFPDYSFRQFVKKYDLNKDNYLDMNEIYKVNSISIKQDRNIKSIKGINIFSRATQLVLSQTVIEDIDLSNNRSILDFCALQCDELVSFKGGAYQNRVELSFCASLSSVDVTRCIYLNELTLVYDNYLRGTLNLTKNSRLKDVTINTTKLKYVEFSPNAILDTLDIEKTPIRSIDISKCVRLGTTYLIVVSTDGSLKSSMVSGDLLNLLWCHRNPDNKGYYYYNPDPWLKIVID